MKRNDVIKFALSHIQFSSELLQMLIGVAIMVFTPVLSSHILNQAANIAGGMIQGNLILWLLGYCSIPMVNGVAEYMYTYSGRRVTEAIGYRLRRRTVEVISRMPLLKQSEWTSGDLLTMFNNDIQMISGVCVETLVPLTRNLLVISISIAYCATISLPITLAVLFTTPLCIMFLNYYNPKIGKSYTALQEAEGKLQSYMQECLQRVPLIKVFLRESNTIELFKSTNAQKIDGSNDLAQKRTTLLVVGNFLAYIPILLVLVLGTHSIRNGFMNSGGFLAFIMLVESALVWPASELLFLTGSLAERGSALERLLKLWDAESEPEVPVPRAQGPLSVIVDHVSFSYREGEEVLKSISFTAEPGELIAIKGGSGSGKSTLVKLLLGLYRASEGEIYLTDGHNRFADVELRHLIAYVPQGNNVLATTIFENISGDRDATEEQVISAASSAGIHEFVSSLSDGYQTLLGPDGITLSEGQAQRVAIARALLKDSPIIIMDEASSALDDEAEMKVIEVMQELSKNKICLFVAHREKMLQSATRTIELSEGRISNEIH